MHVCGSNPEENKEKLEKYDGGLFEFCMNVECGNIIYKYINLYKYKKLKCSYCR